MGALTIMKMDIRRLIRSPKLYLLICFTLFFFIDYARDLKLYVEGMGIGIAPYIYTMFYGSWMTRIFSVMIIAALMSDAPYTDKCQKYTYIRSGNGRWLLGKILYVFSVSFLYQMVMFVVSVLALLPDISLTWEWGDALWNVAAQNSSAQISLGDAGSAWTIVQNYRPVVALLITFVLASLVSATIGMFVFLVNGITRTMLGTILALIISTADLFISVMNGAGIRIQFPLVTSWMDLSRIYVHAGQAGAQPFWEVVCIMLAFCVAAAVVLYQALRLKRIDIARE